MSPALPRPALAAVLAVPLLLPLAACAPLVDPVAAADEERSSVRAPLADGGELVVGLDAEPDALDPTLSTTLVGRQVFAGMCEKLYDVDAESGLVPQLAAGDPVVSGDGLEVRVPLRTDGVRFNDGTPFDADAVVRSLDRHREMPGSTRATELDAVQDVRAEGEDTVVLRLSRPYAPLQSILADRAGMVMSPAALEAHGEDFARDPVCVGPFRFAERVAQDRIVLEKSPEYYAADEVHLDRVVYRPIPDDSIRLANLRAGQLDVIQEVGPTDVAQVSREDGLVLLNQPSSHYMGMTINLRDPDGIGADPRLREALALSLDRETINEVAFGGVYQPACGPIPPISEYADETVLACPGHDPGRARELVAESGAEAPVPVELMIPNDPVNILLGQTVQAMAAEAGFAVRLEPTEFASSIAAAQAGDFEAYISGWSGRPDPDGNIASFFTTGGANNYSGHSDPEVDALIEDAAAATDPDERQELYDELVPRMQEANAVVYLYRQRYYVAHRDGVAGVELYPDGLIRVAGAGRTAAAAGDGG
ncbi:ABC transporter substrate-binding protein [Nocardiopsis sp. RSe5-2]|uniref:ABC transporter substrate-binding protein n=1 Tax=Nocardiopsis endophytica TaxID=3018445 RepID=A0ABT4U505_9ACTN|nr:ABC transporter substrate-binding protein [Nocardiopsis endophytica]MDA2811422.1 ABC transporter substrate-binding protein [Nocardiopsis endophytica]